MKNIASKTKKEPSLKEVGKSFLRIIVIVGLFVLSVSLFFLWLFVGKTLPKLLFYSGFIILFFILLVLFILFIRACTYYLKTEYRRQKMVFKNAIQKVKGGGDRWL